METKIAHLGMIQAVINRMGSNSFLIKGWTITLVAALFALAQKESNSKFMYLAYFPAVIFWALDGYYLRQERLFRKLYDAVRKMKDDDIDFSMKTLPQMNFILRVLASSWQWFKAIISLTLILFHGAIIFAICVVAKLSLN